MFNLLRITSIILIFSIATAMEVRTNSWSGGTEFHFTFSSAECEKLAKNWFTSLSKAKEIYDNMARKRTKIIKSKGGYNMGQEILVDLAALSPIPVIATQIHNASKQMIREYGNPISWTYTRQRKDLLGKIFGFWDY